MNVIEAVSRTERQPRFEQLVSARDRQPHKAGNQEPPDDIIAERQSGNRRNHKDGAKLHDFPGHSDVSDDRKQRREERDTGQDGTLVSTGDKIFLGRALPPREKESDPEQDASAQNHNRPVKEAEDVTRCRLIHQRGGQRPAAERTAVGARSTQRRSCEDVRIAWQAATAARPSVPVPTSEVLGGAGSPRIAAMNEAS